MSDEAGSMEAGSAAREIAGYSFLVVFANDGTIDENELRLIERLALRDGVVDDDERTVLENVFARVRPEDLDPAVRDEIARFRGAVGM